MDRTRIYFASFVANLLFLSTGTALTWTSPARYHINATQSELSWITSLVALGAVFGPFVYSFGIRSIGRKMTLILNGALFLVSWIIILPSQNVLPAIYVGRFLSGVSVGCTFNCIPIYIIEIADDKSRQTLASMCELFISFGYVLIYGAGCVPTLTYTWLTIISALPAIVFLVVMIFLPESPYFLVEKQKSTDALRSLHWLGYGKTCHDQLNVIQDAVQLSKKSNGRTVDLFVNKGPRRAFLISLFMLAVQQFSAVDAITAATQDMFPKTSISEPQQAMIVGAVNVVAAGMAPFIVNKFGGKPTLIIATLLCGLSLLTYGSYQVLESQVSDPGNLIYIPLVSISVFNIFFCIGLGGLPWAISAELFPNSLKGTAISLNSCVSWLIAWFVMWFYEEYQVQLGKGPMFLTWGSIVTLGGLLMTLLVPNTKGMSLQEILDKLEGKSNSLT